MNLTAADKNYIRETMIEVITQLVNPRLDEHAQRLSRLERHTRKWAGETQALRQDVIELYGRVN